MTEPAIDVRDLHKSYGSTPALDGLSLAVPRGSIVAVLGPNGAGKTTLVRILSTLQPPDAGSARICGVDVVAAPAQVRRRIGLSGQFAAVDEYLTGLENLTMVGRLYQLDRRTTRSRAESLIRRLGLDSAADRPARGYSGGMRRRLDLACALIGRPDVLILDEPTTGVDPAGRRALWDIVRGLAEDGVTVLLTTQYLEEADRLADRIAILADGRLVTEGTPEDLKKCLGGDRLAVTVDRRDADRAARLLAAHGLREPDRSPDGCRLSVPVADATVAMIGLAGDLRAHGVEPLELGTERPSLDDVFLALTAAEEGGHR
ncbi:ATP-binding cassette domain-containing protein [Micromonospora sp. HUAS YX12]|uniref:ATP-binding cassette domain-containing protein n=1 Tax=Micromonospora sp. HUAS YX12 TaxID=3156396 RepID=A0AAU7QY19_9ACTN